MNGASIVARDKRTGEQLRAALLSWVGARPLVPALLVIVVTTVLRLSGSVDSDVSWQLWIAHQVNGGARLYRDIVEVNPPLWFWMALPVDRLASLLQIRSDHILIILVSALAAVSLAALNRLLGMAPARRALVLAYVALIFCAMPWMQVGQREQIVLIAAVPYAALVSARRCSRPVHPALALLIGAAAGLGFALKHYFLIVPGLLELWLISGRARQWRPFRPETIAIAAIGAAYLFAMFVWAHDFFTMTLPLLNLAYGTTGAPSLVDLLQPAVLVCLTSLLLVWACRRAFEREIADVPGGLFVAAAGFLAVYLVQAKGWAYHALPCLGLSVAGLAALLAAAQKPPRLFLVAAPSLLLMPFVISAQAALRETLPSADLRRAVDGVPSGQPVGYLATDPALAWSITYQRGLGYPSRYMGFWMMRAVVRNEQLGNPDPRVADLGRRVIRETVTDFRCMPPRRIVVARPTAASLPNDSFDILQFFIRDPEFAELLSHYRRSQRTSLEVYDYASPLPAPTQSCPFRAA